MQIDYIIQYSRRRSIGIQITNDRKVLAKAPFGVSEHVVLDFLREKRDWIIRKIENIEKCEKLASQMGMISKKEQEILREKARSLITQRVMHYASLSGIKYKKIRFAFQKSCWGSCSAAGNLNFNCLLALMPLEIIDSVVVHELCHRRFMNHSKSFYAEVLKYFPDYYRCDRWLKENGKAYFMRLE